MNLLQYFSFNFLKINQNWHYSKPHYLKTYNRIEKFTNFAWTQHCQEDPQAKHIRVHIQARQESTAAVCSPPPKSTT